MSTRVLTAKVHLDYSKYAKTTVPIGRVKTKRIRLYYIEETPTLKLPTSMAEA